MSDRPKPVTFHLRVNDGPEQTITVNTGIYMYAAAAACAMLGTVPSGSEQVHIEIWAPRLLPDYGPVHYLVGSDVYGNVSVRHAVASA
jgi:hypothetical protein